MYNDILIYILRYGYYYTTLVKFKLIHSNLDNIIQYLQIK